MNPGAKEAKPPHAPEASRGYGRVEAPSKLKDRILAFLCEPLVRQGLQWLLLLCLTIEEYLLRILLEE